MFSLANKMSQLFVKSYAAKWGIDTREFYNNQQRTNNWESNRLNVPAASRFPRAIRIGNYPSFYTLTVFGTQGRDHRLSSSSS